MPRLPHLPIHPHAGDAAGLTGRRGRRGRRARRGRRVDGGRAADEPPDPDGRARGPDHGGLGGTLDAVAQSTQAPRQAPAGRMWSVVVTFYGAADNDPPGSTEIAHPNGRHQEAGGSGTYADPLSLAADPRAIPVGTRVYYPPLRKYFVMEDDCAQCITDWRSSRTPHIDLWTGNYQGSALIACENALTPDGLVAVEVNPPPGRPVDPSPLYTGRGCAA